MSRTYGHILHVIETRNYDVLSGRAFVPGVTKLRIAAGVLLGTGNDARWARSSQAACSMLAPNRKTKERLAVG
jgi:hypothetical protein